MLVERMAPPGAELIVSVRRDGFAPVLMVGLGGVLAEALDVAAAARLAVAVTETDFVLMELNPVIVHAHGAVAVDAPADEEVVR